MVKIWDETRLSTTRCLFVAVAALVVVSFISPWFVSTTLLNSTDVDVQITRPSIHENSPHYPYNTIVGPDEKKHCRRPCNPHIRNRIVYTCLHPAGFLDRQELIDNLLELAAFLCATLEFPTPRDSFHPMHNHQQWVHPSLEWTDFFQYSLVDMETNNMADTAPQLALLQTVNLKVDPSFYVPFVKWPQCRRPRTTKDRNREQYGLHVISKDRNEVVNDFDTIRQYSFGHNNGNEQRQQPFLWEIPTNFYSWHKEFRIHIRETLPSTNSTTDMGAACLPWSRSGRYVQQSYPDKVQSLIDDIWDEVVPTSSEENNNGAYLQATNRATNTSRSSLIGFLHIRRGDTIEECDTSIPKLQAYLSCSLSNMTISKLPKVDGSQSLASLHNTSVGITLLVGTNEEDPSYMLGLKGMVEELSAMAQHNGQPVHFHVRAVDMESLIWEFLKIRVAQGDIPSSYLNNLHVFEILEHIMSHRVDFKLSQRRYRFCKDCDKIVIRQSAMEQLAIN